MTDFARGGLLAQLSLTGGEPAQPLYVASLDTEVTLVVVAVQSEAAISLHHDADPSAPFTFDNALLFNYPLRPDFQGPILAAQALGCAIHVKRGQRLGVACDQAATVTLYGVTATLGEIR